MYLKKHPVKKSPCSEVRPSARTLGPLAFLALALIAGPPIFAQNLIIREINVGWGSATYITAPNGTTLYYVVRARNNESCSGSGLTESNVVRVSAQDQTSQSVPGDVGSSVRANGINDAHVRVSWNVVAGAATYNVYRAQTPSGSFTKIGSSTGTFFEDRDQLGNSTPWYYRVKGANTCGVEGP